MEIKVGGIYKFITEDDVNIPYGTTITVTRTKWGSVSGIRWDNGKEWTMEPEELGQVEEQEAPTNEPTAHDPVNKPKHYMLIPSKDLEVIDVIDALCDKLDNSTLLYNKEVSYYAQMMGYLMRFMDKNGLEDLKKARWYLDRIVTNLEANHD